MKLKVLMMGLCLALDEFGSELGGMAVSTAMGMVSSEEIDMYAWYSAAAICPDSQLDEWSCKSCAEVAGPDLALMHFGNLTTETKGFVLVSDAQKSIVVSFRGSNSTLNILANLNFQLKEYSFVRQEGALVHGGYLDITLSCIGQAHDLVAKVLEDETRRDYTIYVVGHSMGASMASLGAIWMKESLGLGWDRFRVITYGQLRTGNLEFAKWYDLQPAKVARVVNFNDSAPHFLQFTKTLVHHHNEVFLNKDSELIRCRSDVVEDPECSNSVLDLEDEPHLHFKSTTFGARAC